MILGIDIDGVLADFNSSYIELVKEVTGRDLFPEGYNREQIKTWNYPEYHAYTKEEIDKVWEVIAESYDFWYDLNAYEDAEAFGMALQDLDTATYFITSRIGKRVKEQSEDWLTKHLGIVNPTVLISSQKGECCHALKVNYYIDDKNENCQDVLTRSPKTLCAMLARPWNSLEGISGGNIIRVASLQEFQEVISGK